MPNAVNVSRNGSDDALIAATISDLVPPSVKLLQVSPFSSPRDPNQVMEETLLLNQQGIIEDELGNNSLSHATVGNDGEKIPLTREKNLRNTNDVILSVNRLVRW